MLRDQEASGLEARGGERGPWALLMASLTWAPGQRGLVRPAECRDTGWGKTGKASDLPHLLSHMSLEPRTLEQMCEQGGGRRKSGGRFQTH